MKNKILINVGLIIGISAVAFAATFGIQAASEDTEEKEPTDTRPIVSIETLKPINHQVLISGFGEVMPLESTVLAAQVSGEIISWNPNFVNGGIVERGDVLFTIEADAYEAEVLRAEAQVSLAEATLTEELARQNVAKRESKNLPKNQVSDLYLRKPQVLSAKAQLKSAQAALRIANRNLGKTKVTAPYDALIISRDIGSGQYVSTGMQVAKINNIETAEIMIPVAGFDSPFLQPNMQGVQASAATRSLVPVTRDGYIDRDLGVVDQSTRMQHLVMRIDDPYSLESDLPKLQFGSYVEVTFQGRMLENVFEVPQSLVNNRKLWIVNEEDKLEAHDVNVLREEGSYFYISSGVTAEDRMAKNLPEYPQNGMEVRIQEPDQALITYNQTNSDAR
ncbi:efflux RND transporter periplasmic adaptor subunit [Agaribacter marinus]|uniref:Membrane protein n=1 Tax=Agaribacter marinus TaxID=1431249 RepID=A0AA37T1C9_9ALTE|nr:efflux RND transporter periplasmic adaptor subunit [Agaribacter marinus]GLR72129.1 membrane protein [Agaribacter marinus]